jgi:hypothetical protein
MKEEIKAWLKTANRDRPWLAKQTGVHKRTVDNWLSSPQEIPESTQRLIRKLMADDAARVREKENAASSSPENFPMTFPVTCRQAEFDAFSLAALAKGMLVKDWALEKLLDAVNLSQEEADDIDGPVGDESKGVPYHEDCDHYSQTDSQKADDTSDR